jgi:hypothetical protein
MDQGVCIDRCLELVVSICDCSSEVKSLERWAAVAGAQALYITLIEGELLAALEPLRERVPPRKV